MKSKALPVFLLGILFLMACSNSSKTGYKIIQDKNGRNVAVGIIPAKDLLAKFPEFSAQYAEFVPDSQAIEFLSQFKDSVQVLVFLGTWCPDSQREVPRFLKALDLANNPPSIQLKLIASDRSKTDSQHLSAKYNIERVPTFVVLYQGKEIGRIVEHPKDSVEKDFIEILKSIQ
jgi:thiol-disulfide isomerase/thioredoxin